MRRVLAPLAIASLLACQGAPDRSEGFNRAESLVLNDAKAHQAFVKRVVTAIDGAKVRVLASFERLEDVTVAQALIRAEARGVDVKVVADVDQRADAGLALLRSELGELDDGSPRLVLLGGDLGYAPQPNRDLTRSGALNRITHTFLIVDSNHVLNASEGFGDEARLTWAYDAHSTDVAKDFEDEHTQLFGGVSATRLSYFDGMLKSNTNNRVYYPMTDGLWELYFGPQERLMKRVVDEIYGARASVQIITSEFANTFMLDALRYKARIGVIVDVMVDESTVDKKGSRFNELKKALADDKTSGNLHVGKNLGVTLVVIDAERARDGRQYQTRVLVVSHELAESIPFDESDVSRASDAFMDGNMWVLSRPSAGDSPVVERALSAFADTFEKGAAP